MLFDLVHDPIVPNTQLPVAFQSFAKGSPVLVRSVSQPRLDCTGYSPMEILWNARDVFVGNGGVVPKLEGHLASRSLEMCPGLRMRHGLAPVERLLPIFRQVGKRSVLFRFQRIFDEISHFERQRDAISFSPAAEPFIDRLFQDNIDARIGCRHGVLVSGFTREKSVPHVMDLDKAGVGDAQLNVCSLGIVV